MNTFIILIILLLYFVLMYLFGPGDFDFDDFMKDFIIFIISWIIVFFILLERGDLFV